MDRYQFFNAFRNPLVDAASMVKYSHEMSRKYSDMPLPELCTVLLAAGRIEAAEVLREELLQEGKQPNDMVSARLTHAIGFGARDAWVPFEHAVSSALISPHSGVIASKLEVLQFIQDSPHWNWSNNVINSQVTPLMNVLCHPINSDPKAGYLSWRFTTQAKEQVVLQLLAMGEDINVDTPYHSPLSAQLSSTDLADIDGDDSNQNMQRKIQNGLDHHRHMINFLRANGADLNKNSHLAYEVALSSVYDHMIQPKQQKLPVLFQFLLDNEIALHSPTSVPQNVALWPQVCLSNLPLVAQTLLDHGVDPNWTDLNTGNTLWHVVCASPDPYAHRLLLSIPAERLTKSAQQSNAKGIPSFHAAVHSLSIPMMQHALDAKASINAATPTKKVAFETIRKAGKKAQQSLDHVAQWILDNGGVLAATKNDAQMLDQACNALALDQIKKLLKAGASPHGSSEKSPAFRVLDAVRTIDPKHRPQAMQKQLACLQQLHAAGADLDAPDKEGNTLLHRAVFHVLPLTTEWLLEQGVQSAVKNKEGNCPFHLLSPLVVNTHPPKDVQHVALSLVEHDIDLDILNADNEKGLETLRTDPTIQAALQKCQLEKELGATRPKGSTRRKM